MQLRAAGRRALIAGALGLIRAYQFLVSPWLGGNCRFHPTCSQYAAEAITCHGLVRGGWLTAKRLLSCRPGGGAGYDPVPGTENGNQ